MFRVHFTVFLVAMSCVLMSLEAEGQSTIDGASETCDNNLLYTSEQVANLIRRGLDKVIASNPHQHRPAPSDTLKHSLVSAIACKYVCWLNVIKFCLFLYI